MARTYRFKARARREIERAVAWWAANRPSAPGAIRLDIEAALRILVDFPDVGTLVESARGRTVRRFLLKRTGYFVYYRIRDDTLEVLAFWHVRREHEPKV